MLLSTVPDCSLFWGPLFAALPSPCLPLPSLEAVVPTPSPCHTPRRMSALVSAPVRAVGGHPPQTRGRGEGEGGQSKPRPDHWLGNRRAQWHVWFRQLPADTMQVFCLPSLQCWALTFCVSMQHTPHAHTPA